MPRKKNIPEKIEEAVVEAAEEAEEKADEIIENVQKKIEEAKEEKEEFPDVREVRDFPEHSKTQNKAEEFPEFEVGVDIFSPKGETKGQEKAEEEKPKKRGRKKKEEKAKEENAEAVKEEERKKKIKFEELKEKAKKLEEKIEKTRNIKEEVEEAARKKSKTLVQLDDYVKSGIHLGTKVITPHMRKYVYRRRADGLAVLNTNIIDAKIKEAIEFFSKYNAEDIILVCKREAGWKASKLFGEVLGIRTFTKKYPAGIITNTILEDFFEPELVIICDPWLDKNALNDAIQTRKKVMSLCDTNNLTNGIDQIVPCNNKSDKSIGLVLYLLAKGYTEEKKLNIKIPEMEIWTGELISEPEKKPEEKVELVEVKEGV